MIMNSLENKVALITGSGSGIGRAAAQHLAARGARIAVQDIAADGADETVKLITAEGGVARAFIADVSNVAAMRKLVSDVEASLGRVDILVNNAGTVNDFCPLEEVTEQMFERSMAVHVRGTLFTTQAVVPGMKQSGYGKIINMSSIQGTVGNPNGATYNAAKGALLSMAKGWAKELAPFNIMVNAVAPGPIVTPMVTKKLAPEYFTERTKTIPIGRWGTPEDIAYAIGYLASPESDFVTGQCLSPNGGCAIT
jgi:NAD(P)-dependent dehydrogenase (short-subunit alcohol dehydrogenase family)